MTRASPSRAATALPADTSSVRTARRSPVIEDCPYTDSKSVAWPVFEYGRPALGQESGYLGLTDLRQQFDKIGDFTRRIGASDARPARLTVRRDLY